MQSCDVFFFILLLNDVINFYQELSYSRRRTADGGMCVCVCVCVCLSVCVCGPTADYITPIPRPEQCTPQCARRGLLSALLARQTLALCSSSSSTSTRPSLLRAAHTRIPPPPLPPSPLTLSFNHSLLPLDSFSHLIVSN